ncbi:MAG: hypothetical protein IPJ26_17410 [Bacteroidetes bacterium]|nr:hypothetical protein [Bacteroidota bacterium]
MFLNLGWKFGDDTVNVAKSSSYITSSGVYNVRFFVTNTLRVISSRNKY